MTRPINRFQSARGNVLALVMGGIALSAILGVTTFSLMSGPLKTITSVNRKAVTQSHVQAIARIALMEAQNQPSYGDCDGDGYVELRAPRDAGVGAASPIEFVPVALGAPTRDPWGNDYLYCTWDIGTVYNDAGCGDTPTLRADGTDDPSSGTAVSQTFVAAFSSGSNGVIDSTCANYTDGTTAVFTCAGDDICQSYTYNEAAKEVNGVWSLKDGAPNTITTTKDIEVGANISIDSATGDANFTALSSTGKMVALGGLKVGLDDVIMYCDVDHTGKLRYNDDDQLIQVCDGTDWVALGAGVASAPAAGSLWQETAPSSGHIYYSGGNVLINTEIPSDTDIVKIVTVTGKDIELSSQSDTASDEFHLDLFHATGTEAAPGNIGGTDNVGYINFQGYGTAGSAGFKKGALITNALSSGGTKANIHIAVGDNTGTLRDALWFDSRGAMTAGTLPGAGMLAVTGTSPNLLIDTYGATAASGSTVLLRKTRGNAGAPSAVSSGDMLAGIKFAAQDSDSMASGNAINFITNGTVNATKLNTDLVIQSDPTGSAYTSQINAEVLRFRSLNSTGQYGGINYTNPVDALNINGTLRVSQSSGNEYNNYAGQWHWSFPEQKLFRYVPADGTWAMGTDHEVLSSVGPLLGFSSLSTGSGCAAAAANAVCMENDDNHTDYWYVLAPEAVNTIAISGNFVYPLHGANSVVLNSTERNQIWGDFTTIGMAQGKMDYWGFTESNYIGKDAHHTTALIPIETKIFSDNAYTFGRKNTILADHVFAVNLNDSPLVAQQSNTMLIMNGNVGVGVNNPTYKTHVVGTAGLSTNASGFWTNYSDARLKDIHGPYEKGLKELAQLQPVRFQYKADNPYGYASDYELTGFIAQAVQPIFPETVTTNESSGYLDFDMHSINVAKINAVQSLYNTQEELRAEQEALTQERQKLLTAIADLRLRTDKMMNAAGIPTRLAFLDRLNLALAIPCAMALAFGAGFWRRRKNV